VPARENRTIEWLEYPAARARLSFDDALKDLLRELTYRSLTRFAPP
jgi:hypothetical protein